MEDTSMTALNVLQTLTDQELALIQSICVESMGKLELTTNDGSIDRFLLLNGVIGKLKVISELNKKVIKPDLKITTNILPGASNQTEQKPMTEQISPIPSSDGKPVTITPECQIKETISTVPKKITTT